MRTGLPPNPNPPSPATSLAASSSPSGPDVTTAEAKVGDRMMVHHYQGCTQCSHCRSGWQQLARRCR